MQNLVFRQQGKSLLIEINDGDLFTGCGGGLEGDASGVLKRFLSVYQGDL